MLSNVFVLHVHGKYEKDSHFGQNDEGLDEKKCKLSINNDEKNLA